MTITGTQIAAAGLACSAVRPSVEISRVTGVARPAFSVPHLISGRFHLGEYGLAGQAGNLVTLGAVAAPGPWLLALGPRPRSNRIEPGNREDRRPHEGRVRDPAAMSERREGRR
jgi:hypothetical protein